jgi:type II secretory pathway pseudopilin PulG
MTKPSPTRRPHPSEQGFALLAVLFLVALMTLSLAIALPKISRQIQRDRELETMNRGKQYARAVKMYYKKFGFYPSSVDLLVKPTNNVRFLRKKYVDPTTGKDDWKPIYLGHNKAPTVWGFFGVPLGGAGPCSPDLFAGTTSTNTSSTTTPPGSSGSSSAFPSGNARANGAGCEGPDLNPPDPSTTAGATPPANQNAANGGTPDSTSGLNGQTFGGGPIMGFSPKSPKQSILVYKKKSHYNEWEFVFDPAAEQIMMQSTGGGLTPNGMPGSSGSPGNPGGPGNPGNPGIPGNPNLPGSPTGGTTGGNSGTSPSPSQ